MSLYFNLRNTYGLNNPFLLSDITNKSDYDSVKMTLSNLVKKNLVRRFSNGVYYLPKNNELLGELHPSIDDVIKIKYINNMDKTYGYYTGYVLLNEVGLTTQVPNTIEVCTNKETNIKRDITLNGMNIILRKPICEINNANVRYLQFIDIFRYCDLFALLENNEGVKEFIRVYDLKKEELKPLLKYAPHRAVDYMFGSGMFNELK